MEYQIKIVRSLQKEENVWTDVQLFYIIDGEACIRVGKQDIVLQKSDFIVVNAFEKYHWISSSGTTAAVINMDFTEANITIDF